MRSTSHRVSLTATVAVLVFFGLATGLGGNALVALFDFILAGLGFGAAVVLARRGEI